MYSKEVVIKNQVGLHARPATYFIQKANEFKDEIKVTKDEREVNAKSLLGVLSLASQEDRRSSSQLTARRRRTRSRRLSLLSSRTSKSNI